MTRNRDYFIELRFDDVRMRVRFLSGGKDVLEFLIQLEILLDQRWYPVVRFDTAHGYAHKDMLAMDGSQEKTELNMAYNEAMSYAVADIKRNWKIYVQDFLKGASR